MTAASTLFLDTLRATADEAERAEGQFRREIAQRIALLERERAFAFRRLNLMRTVTNAVTGAESAEVAIANGLYALCDKLGWITKSPARDEVLSHFTPVVQSIFEGLGPPTSAPQAEEGREGVQGVLAAFETWYAGTHEAPFWALFDHYIPETPRVDF
jgi:hypothetical protein